MSSRVPLGSIVHLAFLRIPCFVYPVHLGANYNCHPLLVISVLADFCFLCAAAAVECLRACCLSLFASIEGILKRTTLL